MTEQEYIEVLYTLEQKARENKRAHAVQMQILEDKHRENVQNERDRYNIAVRRQKAEYAEMLDNIHLRITEVKKQRAASRAEEERAAATCPYPKEE